ncbi:uncharacterized protein LOC135217452 isoform X2 [Macrobrachium nipponense]|uniref:uncharacterized protein LOC135217452 isoform X2 n=1 Tax=Macrobrachium nipponense TaxID=159736 RepID=UPI0030C81457
MSYVIQRSGIKVGSIADAIICLLAATYIEYPGYWASFAGSLLGVVLAVVLINGAKERKTRNLKLWVLIATCLLVIGGITSIAISVVSGVYALVILDVFICLLQMYYIVVVRSYVIQLQREDNAAIRQSNTQQLYVLYL